MVKYKPIYTVWRQNKTEYFALAFCEKTQETALYLCNVNGEIRELNPSSDMDPVTVLVQSHWHDVPLEVRAALRTAFSLRLECKYGAESSADAIGPGHRSW